MMVIAKNAEQAFLSKVDTCLVENMSMRCLFLRLSSLDLDYKTWFPRFAYELSRFFDDETLCLYVCKDRDVFILNRMITVSSFEKFLTHLTPKLKPALETELADLFEIGVHGGRLRTICKAKIDALRKVSSAVVRRTKDSVKQVTYDQTLGELDADLLSSLPMRRDGRKKSEIMVVEDDLFSQKLIQNSLEKYSVQICGDGRGAIMSYVAKAPDILFLDIGLPDIDGLEVLRKIFEIDPQAFVVMFSGNGSRENITQALKIGAKGFVGKPFTKDKLVAYIDQSPHITKKERII